MILQIYEIQNPFEAEKCIESGVDHIGSVILSQADWKKSDIREAIKLSVGTPVKNSIIPLFRDMDTMCRLLDYYRPDFIHFCESLTDEEGSMKDLDEYIRFQSEIKERFSEIGLMRSIPVPVNDPAGDFPTMKIAQELEPLSDYFLTDTWLGREPVEGFIGITGKRCDPKIAGELVKQSAIPVILAGGLSPDNVYDALMDVRPAGADSCTMTNQFSEDGRPIRFRKDFEKVKKFVGEVKRAERDAG
ncbi:MAG: hypothetical protein JW882_03140 [Deltaproteobacteria bacterium]|nr:hypothetical protein [Deltaproteobacteria bacterium]